MYATASLGNNLVWVFQREANGLLTAVVDPAEAGSRPIASPQGSYSAPIVVNDLLFVAVEKDNLVYAARRNEETGRLLYLPTAVGEVSAGGTATAEGEAAADIPPTSNTPPSAPAPPTANPGPAGGDAAAVTAPKDGGATKRPVALAFNPAGNVLYVSEDTDASISTFQITSP